jgi:hypothetical protein
MARLILCLLPISVLAISCAPPVKTSMIVGVGCVPIKPMRDDPNTIHAAFHRTDNDYDYIVFTYGREKSLDPSGSAVRVDGGQVEIPGKGKAFVLDPQHNLHELPRSANELGRIIWGDKALDLYQTPVWQNEIYPRLKDYAWGQNDTKKVR